MHLLFNLVSRQAMLDECAPHFPELLPWASWCYGQHPLLRHHLSTMSAEIGLQQGDPLSPALFFCLVLQVLVSSIASDEGCSSLLFNSWYQDDGVITGPRLAVSRALSIIQEQESALGLFNNAAKCELFSLSDLSMFPSEMKKSNVPHFEILGSSIGDAIFCTKYVSSKCAIASKLLTQLEEVGSVNPKLLYSSCANAGVFANLYI